MIHEHGDGFEVARLDLEQRGPGEFLGERQSGMPLLRFADLQRDAALAVVAQTAAEDFITKEPGAARRHVERWLGSRQDLTFV